MLIPSLLRQYTGGQEVVNVTTDAATVYNIEECLKELTGRYQVLRKWLYSEQGEVAGHVRLFKNGRQVAAGETLEDGDEVLILLAVSGG